MGTSDDNRLARIEERRHRVLTAARAIAAELRANKNMHQEHAAIKAGLTAVTYWRYMGSRDADDELVTEFQSIVVPAVHEQADLCMIEAETAIGCVESGSGAWAGWMKWKMEKRYRKIYGDLAQELKVELTGKDGGPLQTVDVGKLSDAELDAMLERAKRGGGE